MRFFGYIRDYWRQGAFVLLLSCALVWVALRLVVVHFALDETLPDAPDYVSERRTDKRGEDYAIRGRIYSSNNVTLALTVPKWNYYVDALDVDPRHNRKSRSDIITNVAARLSLPLEKVERAFTQGKNRHMFIATSYDQQIYDDLCGRQRNGIKKNPGLISEMKEERSYPQKMLASNVIGFVTKDPAHSVGGAGIEQRYESELKGRPGKMSIEVDGVGRKVNELSHEIERPMPGKDIWLTIDSNVQYDTERALAEGLENCGGVAGWAVVLKVKTGEILAMASLPTYSPTNFNAVPVSSYQNLPLSVAYEPGSVMKTITAAAALDLGVTSPDRRYYTENSCWMWAGKPLRESHRMEPFLSAREGLVHSSNIVYAKIGLDVGQERLWTYFHNFGFGQRTGVELPGETRGILPYWKDWDKLKWTRAPIGQGVCVTAIQIANAYACIANDGVLMKPYIVARIEDEGKPVYVRKPETVRRVIKADTARKVREMLLGVASKEGTARRAAVKGYTVSGKTGTAQMPGPGGHGYSQTDFRGSFIGIIPASRPELVILVTYEKGMRKGYMNQGGMNAAPVFRKIAESATRYLHIEPDKPEELQDGKD